jgi:hypothetical protein
MDPLFEEREADKQIIDSLLKTNRTLWRELEQSRSMVNLSQQTKRGHEVKAKILQDLNGIYYLAKEYVLLVKEDAEAIIRDTEHDFVMAHKFLEAKVADASDQPPHPADKSQATPADQSQQVPPSSDTNPPAAPASPAPAAPENQAVPALDANGNPVQTAPAPDPNQAQPQTEQPVIPPLQ